MDMSPWILLTVLVLIALAAPRYGVDSRLAPTPPGQDPPPPRHGPTPWGDALALARALAHWARHTLTRPHRQVAG